MVKFKTKEFPQKTLGERLKEIREELGISPEELSNKLGISKKYLLYLEQGKYSKLPGEVYIRSFLKKYAAALSVNEKKVLALYDQEKEIYRNLDGYQAQDYLPPQNRVKFSVLNPRTFRKALIILFILVILVYLGWELRYILTPPKLEIIYPPDNLVTEEKNIMIQGKTEPEVKILVNGEEVYVEKDGSFKEEIILKEGVNIIAIIAHKKQGEENNLVRKIYLKTNNK